MVVTSLFDNSSIAIAVEVLNEWAPLCKPRTILPSCLYCWTGIQNKSLTPKTFILWFNRTFWLSWRQTNPITPRVRKMVIHTSKIKVNMAILRTLSFKRIVILFWLLFVTFAERMSNRQLTGGSLLWKMF